MKDLDILKSAEEFLTEDYNQKVLQREHKIVLHALERKGLLDVYEKWIEQKKINFLQEIECPFRFEISFDNVKTLCYKDTKIVSYKYTMPKFTFDKNTMELKGFFEILYDFD